MVNGLLCFHIFLLAIAVGDMATTTVPGRLALPRNTVRRRACNTSLVIFSTEAFPLLASQAGANSETPKGGFSTPSWLRGP